MAVTQVGNRVYAKITDLSEEATLNDGDKIIFHCASSGNASLIDWTNVKIDLDHTTFGNTFNSILNFTQTASAWVDTMTESFNDIQSKCNEAIELSNKSIADIEAIKMLIRLIIGIASQPANNSEIYSPEQYRSMLSPDAKRVYDEIMSDITNQTGRTLDLSKVNLTWLFYNKEDIKQS